MHKKSGNVSLGAAGEAAFHADDLLGFDINSTQAVDGPYPYFVVEIVQGTDKVIDQPILAVQSMEKLAVIIRNATAIAPKPHLPQGVFDNRPTIIKSQSVRFEKVLESIIFHFRQTILRTYPQHAPRVQIQ